MKKIQVIIILIALCFQLVACDPGSYQFDYEDLLKDVVSVELINYDNPEQRKFFSWVPDHSSKLSPFKISNMTILETLDNDDITAFIKQLSEISFLDKYYVFDSPKGISIRVIYANGDFEVISCDYEKKSFCGYIGKYTSSGDVVDFIGSFTGFNDFESLISNFFETKLD